MAQRGTGGRILGRLANAFAAGGQVYNPYTGQYAPAPVRTARLVSGGLNTVGGPAGTLGALVYSGLSNRTPAAQAWDASLRGWQNINRQLSQRPAANQLGLDVPNAPQNVSFGQSGPNLTFAPAAQPMGAQPNLGSSNAFTGTLGNWANASMQPTGRSYGQAAGSFTPYGAGVVQVAGQGWGGQSAAQGFGLGSGGSGASAGADALSDAMRARRRFGD